MKDRFSKQASAYAAFRPTYPKALYDFLVSHVDTRSKAWDCATGNGQVAKDLAPYFKEVHATDISVEQIKKAAAGDNIFYSVCPAEKTPFPDNTFDLITVGQAVHWFEFDAFYAEVRRVAKKNSVIAMWGYGLLKINPGIDVIISDFYVNVIGRYWDPERRHIDQYYKSIPFPFEEIQSPEFAFSFSWTISELEGYLNTWSSVQKFIQTNEYNPVESLMQRIVPLWKDEKMMVSFPLFMKVGRVT
ncbi:MAG TPA: class I SAM-dependent methyltransferase [Cyclobacteriaceae bacterium]|nr:class I SAM-dependent methyltransferase [Cyclobacteriaceae bacterium]